jgi:peptidoglycan lytic transglycosylase D
LFDRRETRRIPSHLTSAALGPFHGMLNLLLPLCLGLGPPTQTLALPLDVRDFGAPLETPVVAPVTAAPADEAAATAGDGESEDDPAVARKVDEQSEELEEMRALEDATIDGAAPGQPRAEPGGGLRAAVRRLGLGNPMRHHLLDVLQELDDAARDASAGPPELPLVTDLSSFDVGSVKDGYDIPVEMQPLVAEYIHFFQGAGRIWFRKWMSRSTRYIPVMQPILEAAGVPRDLVYLAMIESGFSPQAYSWARAAGPWQFITATGKLFGLRDDFWVDERRDPLKSTGAAARFLKNLHDDLGHWYLAWAGYNAGGGKVRRMMEKKGTSDFWELSDGKGFAKETKHYVPKLIAAALVAKHPHTFGFSDDEFDFQPKLEFDTVDVPAPTDLEVLARAAGTTVDELSELNPELKRWCTPPLPGGQSYHLRVPPGQGAVFAENYPKLAPAERLSFKVHKVKRGDTLSSIAAAYASAPEAIMQMNRLRNPRSLKVSTELIIPVPSARASREGRPDAAMERQVARAKRSGFAAAKPEEEVPAGASNKAVAVGPVKTEVVSGKTRITYGVQNGDSLWVISQRFNCSVDDLRKWNGLARHARRLQVGTLLSVWPGEAPAAAPVQNVGGTLVASAKVPAPKTHLLVAGDSLWSVAQHYGLSVADLKKWNGITDQHALKPGQTLVLAAP